MSDSSGVTVGIDIGSTSVKALAVDGQGAVLARARVEHEVHSPAPDLFQHDVDLAWRENVRTAFAQVADGREVHGVSVAAFVPSLCAVDDQGCALTPGLLYGDGRGGAASAKSPAESGEVVRFLEWCAREAPDAAGYWPAQAVANHALGGVAAVDPVVAITTYPLFDYTAWDPAVARAAGARVDQLPRVVPTNQAVANVGGAVLGSGTVDALAEQTVAGADDDGDALVILGTTLITWTVLDRWREVEGLWTLPHTAPGKSLIGGPSNAGGLFLNWVDVLLAPGHAPADPRRVPVWLPYVRGERTPLHDPALRASLHGLDLTHGPDALRRAAFEASGFVVRHHLDLAGVEPRRLVATGGGVRVAEWVQALADATALPVDVVAVPEGGALGAAYLARVSAGLELDASGAGRWARVGQRVEPDPAWVEPMEERYHEFRVQTARLGLL